MDLTSVPADRADAVRDALTRGLTVDPAKRPGSATEIAAPFRGARGAVPLIGRNYELGRLRSWLEEAISGNGAAALVSGDPGIGKSTLLTTLAAQADLAGVRTLWGRCWEGRSSPAYLPWAQIVAALLRTQSELVNQVPNAGVLARLVPELHDERATVATDHASILFAAVRDVIRATAIDRPLLLLLDDLHLADRSTVRLLHHIADGLDGTRILLVGAYRQADAAADPWLSGRLDALAPDRHVALEGLDGDAVGAMTQLLLGESPPTEDVDHLLQATGGNPFFLDELLRLTTSVQRRDDLDTSVPENVRQAVRRRITQLEPRTQAVLDVAAVVGRSFDAQVVADACAPTVPTTALASLLRGAANHGVVGLGHDALWRFTHDVIRETLYTGLPDTERRMLHARVGEAMESWSGGDGTTPAASLAQHFIEAAPLGYEDRAVRWCRAAGEQAVARLADEEAVGHFQRALEHVGADEALRCALLVQLGEAQWRTWDATATAASMLEAISLATKLGEWSLAAQAARGIQVPPTWLIEAQETVLASALAAIGQADPRARAHLLASYVRQDADARRLPLKGPMAHEAIELARSLDDAQALEHAYEARRTVLLGTPLAAERAELAQARLQMLLEDPGDDVFRCLAARRDCIYEHLVVGDLTRAQAEIGRFAAFVAERPSSVGAWALVAWKAMIALHEGRFETAMAHSGDAFAMAMAEEADEFGRHGASSTWLLQEGVVRLHRGTFGGLVPIVEAVIDRIPWVALRCALAAGLTDAGRPEEARELVADLTRDSCRGIPQDSTWTVALTLLTEAAIATQDRTAAESLYRSLEPHAGLCEPGVQWASAGYGCLSRPLGQLAALLDDRSRAEQHFEEAARVDEAAGAIAWLAHTHASHAVLLDRLGGPRDRQRADALRTSALTTAQALEMPPIVALLQRPEAG
jgi:hypothetical protein